MTEGRRDYRNYPPQYVINEAGSGIDIDYAVELPTGTQLDTNLYANISVDYTELDGQYLRNDGDTGNGDYTINGGLTVVDTHTNPDSPIKIQGTNPTIWFNDTDGADFWTHTNSNKFYVLTNYGGDGAYSTPHPAEWDNATSEMYVYGNKVWHAGNDGSGSGLDADLLDGFNLIRNSATVDTVAGRDASGDIFARLFRSTYTSQTGSIPETSEMCIRHDNSSDNYHRFFEKDDIQAWLGSSVAAQARLYLHATSPAILNHFNVTGLTRNSVGNFTVYYTDQGTTSVSASFFNFSNYNCQFALSSATNSSMTFTCRSPTGTLVDPQYTFFTLFTHKPRR